MTILWTLAGVIVVAWLVAGLLALHAWRRTRAHRREVQLLTDTLGRIRRIPFQGRRP